MTDLTLMGDSPFDAIRRNREDGSEYWSARDLMPLMGYSRWETFLIPVERAMRTAENTGLDLTSNFQGSLKISTTRPGNDYLLSRDAAYLVAMNGDPNKPEVASAQAYFVARTRESETRQTSTTVVVSEISRRELAAMVIAEADRADAAEQRARELEPAAQSWHTLAEASGDYSLREAAQILDRDPSIRTGQNRLSKHLKNIGWTDLSGQPYQRQVDMGRLVVRSRTYTDPVTREERVTTQLRVTARGLQVLHQEMGGSRPLMTVAS